MKNFSSTAEECPNSKSHSEFDRCRSTRSFSRQPSLADIPSIASNCSSSPIMTRGKDSEMNRESRSEALDSEIARTENSIALLAAQSSNVQYKYRSLVEPATPPKPAKNQDQNAQQSTSDEPLTPTANLKMLVSAASPAIRDRESKKRELFTDSGESEPPSPNPCVVPSFALPIFDSKVVYRDGNFVHLNPQDGTEKMAISRKDKSLGLLCQRFLAKYPENPLPQDRIEISLDEVAKDLSVERRRIYDIVNVLESVEVISRFAKNRYMWHGKTKLPQTLAKLKHYALTQGFTTKGGLIENENPSSSKRTSNGKENPSSNSYSQTKGSKPGINDRYQQILPKNSKLYGSGMACLSSVFDSEEDEVMAWARKQKEADYCRKDKSLGVLSQKFLMMFLISDTKQVTLDDAANLLIDEQEEGKAKYKTKVRRLYDIANILSSLQLIQKVHIHNIQSGRKPGFRWIGMDLDKLEIQRKEPREPVNASKKAMVSKNSLVEKELEEESAFGRLISRRPSQQQLRHTKSDRGTKGKLPRSRSDRVLTCKKRVLSCDEENVQSNKEDGYSVQELIDLKGEATRSPDSVKFHSELMKLKEQYPDRMSQLLSACSTLQGLPVEDKKSRRTLFVSEAYIDAPMPKRRKSTEDSPSDDTNDKNGQFVHSFTSPFKPFNDKKNTDSKVDENSEDCGTLGLKQGSPEQKILLERKKQQKLLEEQKDFQLEDERWKRMEHELDKAFSKPEVPKSDSSLMFERSHPSVGIQANLIADVSPLKPLSHYVHSLQLPNPLKASEALYKAATSPPVNFQNMGVSPLVSNSVNSSTLSETPLAHISANDMPMSSKTVQNVKLVSLSSANLSSLWTMSSPRPIPTQPSIYHLTLPQQQVLSSTLCNPTTQAPVPKSTSVLMSNPQQRVLSSTLCNPTTQAPVQSTSVLMSNPQQQILSSTLCNPTTQAPVQSTSVLMSNPQQQILSSTLCNPTIQAPVQSTSVLMPNPQQPNHGFNNMIQVTSATLQPSVTLPMDIVSSLNTHGLVQNSPQDCKITRPIITVQQSLSQGFTPRMAMGPVSNIQGVQPIGATPILSKVMAQQMYSPMTTGTPGSNASFLHSEIAKKLVMPESRLTQS